MLPEEGKKEDEIDAGKAEKVDSGVFSEKLAPTAVLSWERRFRRRVSTFFFDVFLGAVKGPHSPSDCFLNGLRVLRARNIDMSHEDITKKASHGYGGTFHFFEKSENWTVEFRAVAAEALHLSKEEAWAESEVTSVELFVEIGLVQ